MILPLPGKMDVDLPSAGIQGCALSQSSLFGALYRDIADDLGMFPTGSVGRCLYDLRQQIMGDGLLRELADASATSDTFVCSHG